jgi:hypothetical protein
MTCFTHQFSLPDKEPPKSQAAREREQDRDRKEQSGLDKPVKL